MEQQKGIKRKIRNEEMNEQNVEMKDVWIRRRKRWMDE